jgi:hypothetical protein
VLNISAERDKLVQGSASFIERVGSADASNLSFPTGHLGLMVSRSAHDTLWPRVAAWLRSTSENDRFTARSAAPQQAQGRRRPPQNARAAGTTGTTTRAGRRRGRSSTGA